MKQNLIFDETEQVFTMDFGELHQVGSNITVDQNYTPESENAQSGKAVAEALEPIQASIKLIEGEKAGISYVDNEITGVKTALNDKANKDHTHADKADKNHTHADIEEGLTDAHARINELNNSKANKVNIITDIATAYGFNFLGTHNKEIRLAEVTNISFTFGDGEYNADYTSGLSFDSGATPTAIDYTDSGILNWVGTDCTTSDGLSIFQPSANTHYDIVFYFNGKQFIGLVNGFVPATGNEAV